MSDLLKIVTRTLAERQVRPGAGSAAHPEADVLTAFVERALPEDERGPVLGHLAECAECREIVALAQPALVEASAAWARPARLWSRGLILRWGALAACAVLAGALVLRYGGAKPGPLVAEQKAPAAPNSAAPPPAVAGTPVNPSNPVESNVPAAKEESAVADKAATDNLKGSANEVEVEARAAENPRHRNRPLSIGPAAPMSNNSNSSLGYVANNSSSSNSARQNAPAVPAGGVAGALAGRIASTRPLADEDMKTPLARSEGALKRDSQEVAKASPRQDSPPAGEPSLSKNKVQVPASTEVVQVEAAAATVDNTLANAYNGREKDELHASSSSANLGAFNAARQAVKWQISESGALQRSVDDGKTWESVTLDQAVKLRAVTAAGFHIWAGGDSGALFHSQDGGDHFAAVKVHRRHSVLTGDIVTLTFQDVQHGRLETASHEVWLTTDGGQSWHRP